MSLQFNSNEERESQNSNNDPAVAVKTIRIERGTVRIEGKYANHPVI
jgi:hypothetical protein